MIEKIKSPEQEALKYAKEMFPKLEDSSDTVQAIKTTFLAGNDYMGVKLMGFLLGLVSRQQAEYIIKTIKEGKHGH